MSSTSPSQPLSDETIIRSVLSGAVNAYEELVLRYQPMVFAMIKRQVGDEASAKDLAQETFVKAFRNLKGFRQQSSFGTWVTRIALNTTNTYFSSRRYREGLMSVPFDPERHDRQAEASNEPALQRATLLLQKAVASLKPKYREVIVLCSLEGKTYEDAAEILEIPVGTVCSRMNRALGILRNKFRTAGEEFQI